MLFRRTVPSGVESHAPGGAGVRTGSESDLDTGSGVLALPLSSRMSFGVDSGGVELGRGGSDPRRGLGSGVAAQAPGGLGVFKAVRLPWKLDGVVGEAGCPLP